MIYTADDVCRMARALIAERYESQAQAARSWGMQPQILNDALQGRRAMPGIILDKLGLQRVVMYSDGAP